MPLRALVGGVQDRVIEEGVVHFQIPCCCRRAFGRLKRACPPLLHPASASWPNPCAESDTQRKREPGPAIDREPCLPYWVGLRSIRRKAEARTPRKPISALRFAKPKKHPFAVAYPRRIGFQLAWHPADCFVQELVESAQPPQSLRQSPQDGREPAWTCPTVSSVAAIALPWRLCVAWRVLSPRRIPPSLTFRAHPARRAVWPCAFNSAAMAGTVLPAARCSPADG